MKPKPIFNPEPSDTQDKWDLPSNVTKVLLAIIAGIFGLFSCITITVALELTGNLDPIIEKIAGINSTETPIKLTVVGTGEPGVPSLVPSPIPTIEITTEPTETQFPPETLIPPTIRPTLTNTPSTVTTTQRCTRILNDNAVPQGSTTTFSVNSGEFHLWAGSNFCIDTEGAEQICVTSSETSGNMLAFIPSTISTAYALSNLVPQSNWHGVFEGCSDIAQQGQIDVQVNSMLQNGCTGGCQAVEITIIQGNEIISSETRTKN